MYFCIMDTQTYSTEIEIQKRKYTKNNFFFFHYGVQIILIQTNIFSKRK